MAVAFDFSNGFSAVAGFTGTGTSFTGTPATGVGAGSNRVLLGLIMFGSNVSTIPASLTMTWDSGGTNQAMTEVSSSGQTDGRGGGAGKTSCACFGVLAPTSGAKTLIGSWTGTTEFAVAMASFTGADQGSITGTCPGASNSDSSAGGSNPATISITSTASDAMCAICVDNNSVGGTTNSDTLINTWFGGGTMDGGAQYAVGTGTHALTWTNAGGAWDWAIAGTRIIAVGGVSGGTPTIAFNKQGGIIRRTTMVGFRAPSIIRPSIELRL